MSTGASPQWGNESGTWTTSSGTYFATAPTGIVPGTYSSLPYDLTDFSIQVDITDIGDGGLWLRSQDNQNGVLLVTGGDGYWAGAPNPQAGRDLYWHVFVNGVGNPGGFLSRVSNIFDPGVTDAQIRVDVVGNTYDAYVNDVLVSTLVDSTYSHGRVALFDAVNPQQTFDNVVLAVIPEPSSSLMAVLTFMVLAIRRRIRIVE